MRVLPAAVLSMFAFAGPALADESAGGVYKCTDKNGAVTYSTSPCKGAKREFLSREKLEGKITTIEFPRPDVAATKPAEAAAAEPTAAGTASASEKAPAGSAAATTVAPPAVANPKIRTSPIERKPGKD